MSAPQNKSRILFVDDIPANIRILVEVLKEDYDVVFADNGQEGIKIAASDPQPDLILLDIMMPEMNGYEVCEKLKSDKKTSDIPVMFVTALTDDEEEEKGLKLGAVDYIKKPFSMGIVKSRVKTHLDLKHHRDSLKKQTEELAILNEQLEKEIAERKKTEKMVQEHLGYLQQLIKENAFPASRPLAESSDNSIVVDHDKLLGGKS
ncbi:MAG: response regulator [Desulfobulbaceae bacterium]|nr:response regulator [Desulfobulbaceae bacterium]